MSALDPTKLTHNEVIKQAIPTLAGNIAATMADPAADRFSEDDQQFIKFHGIYQQDDRDLRKTAKKYMMMIRGRIPGGVMTSAQWITFDDLATQYGNNTLRVTTRQSIQFHGVLLSGLGALIKKINESLLSTLAACGDVNRNITASPTPAHTKARELVYADSVRLAEALAPQTKAYHSIWIDGVQLNLDDPTNKDFVDPLYGRTYLPRKFKASLVIPPVNDMDIFTNDLGFIAIVEGDKLLGYNLAVGGGMGRSHGNVQTFPRLADVIGFLPPEQVIAVAKAVLTIHRDFGDRTNRKHARLKYVLEERGADWMRDEVNRRTGFTLGPVRPYEVHHDGRSLRLASRGGRLAVPHALRRDRPHQGRARPHPEDRAAPGRGAIPAHRVPPLGQPERHSRQRARTRPRRHHRAARRPRREGGQPGLDPARGRHGLPFPAHLRPWPRGIRAHAPRSHRPHREARRRDRTRR
jgi:sulfite reductase (NADPH) hemoprotein beta-component